MATVEKTMRTKGGRIETPSDKPAPQQTGYKDRPWIPRFWDGMIASAWYPLLWKNHFHVTPRRWLMAGAISSFSIINSLLGQVQRAVYGRKIAETQIDQAPIFVIGHWRSGTTLLHELLVLDPRHTFPNTYDCFTPCHFLVSAPVLRPFIGLLLPKQRPMDNMAAGWDCPQEDEFALCNMGVPSPYLNIAFSNHELRYQEYFDLQQISGESRERWKAGLLQFMKCLTIRDSKRIVMKSPPHTFRIKTLVEMFPEARFVHIVRNPYVVFPSTVNLWKRLYRDEGLQMPRYEGLEEQIFDTFNRMYQAFDRDRHRIAPGRYCEIRYEDLVARPVAQMETVYGDLGLDGFEAARPALEAYFSEKADYKTNQYQMKPELRAEITRRWGWFADRYGYASGEGK